MEKEISVLLLSSRQMVVLNNQPGPATSAQKRGGEGIRSDVDKEDLATVHETTDAYENVGNIDKYMASCYGEENAL